MPGRVSAKSRQELVGLARKQISSGDIAVVQLSHRPDFAIVDYKCAIINAMVAGGLTSDEAEKTLNKLITQLRKQVTEPFTQFKSVEAQGVGDAIKA